MSNTYRKDKNGKKFKESDKSTDRRFRCRCVYCTNAEKNKITDKIAEKELKQQIKTDEHNFKTNGEFIEDKDDPYYTSKIVKNKLKDFDY